jgi:hypothetical protein
MFVLVSRREIYHPETGFAELERYFYSGQTIVSDVVVTPNFGQFVIVEAPDARLAQDLQSRLQSGLFGAQIFETKVEAENELSNWNSIR